MGIAIKSLFSKGNEVTGFKRRKKADPRFGDQAYPGFVDRRSEPHDLDPRYDNRALLFFREHHQLERKTLLALGVLVILAVFMLCSVCLVSLAKTTSGRHEIRKTVNPIVAL